MKRPRTRQKLYLHEPVAARSLMARASLAGLLKSFPERVVWAAFVFVTAVISMLILVSVARLTRTPFVFPSVGPTAILFFFHPMSPNGSPRHVSTA
ncbi:MAG TPA: hypothetical protein VGZ29_13150 [Terriglobia bacterium]|nr:hypothetical protein [Terriglobia bacterium]